MGSVPREIDATQAGTRRGFPTPSIGLFLALQVLDVFTTMIGLRLGAKEGSTFIGHLLQTGPLSALIVSKILAAGLAAIAVFLNRKRILVFLNVWFGAVVAWNVIAIVVQYASS